MHVPCDSHARNPCMSHVIPIHVVVCFSYTQDLLPDDLNHNLGTPKCGLWKRGVWTLPRSTNWRDSRFWKKINGCGEKVVFDFWKIRPQWGTVLLGVTTYFIFLFLKWGKSSKNKNPSMTPVKKKRSTKLDFWVRESGYLSARYLRQGNTLLSPKFGLY